jgi:hypothetical protein
MLLKVKIYLYFVVISVFGSVLLILFQYICCALLKRSITIIVCPAHIHSNARTHARTNNVWVCSLPSYSPIDPSAVLYCTSYTPCLRTPPSSLSFFLSFPFYGTKSVKQLLHGLQFPKLYFLRCKISLTNYAYNKVVWNSNTS